MPHVPSSQGRPGEGQEGGLSGGSEGTGGGAALQEPVWGEDPVPGWCWPPPWEPCPGATCVCAFSALSVCRVGTTLRSSPTPGLWATAWSPLRTQCSDAARSFSRRQPTRPERDFQRPPPRPKESPWPGFWVGCQGPSSSGPGHLPHITCCKAHLDGTRVCVDAHSAVSAWGAGLIVLHLHGAGSSCCLYSEQNGFLSAPGGGMCERWNETEPALPACPRRGAEQWGRCIFART